MKISELCKMIEDSIPSGKSIIRSTTETFHEFSRSYK